jgi:DNA-3-methyladenine glycosylase I
MEKQRCLWCIGDPLYEAYHDLEWGVPVYEDAKLFEFLTLETFQAGLSWITVLRKRENFRIAFDDFDYHKIANYNEKKYKALVQDKTIIRNKLKIKATITNAQAFIEVQKEFGTFSQFIWAFTNGEPIQNQYHTIEELPASTSLSEHISNNLRQRGFKFVGPNVIYAHMQATGMVNDHTTNCFRYNAIKNYRE